MRKWYPAVLVALSFVISIIAFGHLPDPMPIHWDIHGRVNGYGSRWVGAFLNPLVLLGIAIMIPVLPKIDPRGRNYEKFGTSYLTMMNTIATVLFVIHILVLANVLGMNVSIACRSLWATWGMTVDDRLRFPSHGAAAPVVCGTLGMTSARGCPL